MHEEMSGFTPTRWLIKRESRSVTETQDSQEFCGMRCPIGDTLQSSALDQLGFQVPKITRWPEILMTNTRAIKPLLESHGVPNLKPIYCAISGGDERTYHQ
eukprot:Protomagalhaensia_wolfi_Nauph_80__4462@NODE_4573_length_545_cov_17_982213_g3668_i0_p2_GENE_NODE_4573_length_545_cov_17_982213_g3668_i0NODE_4573_length_545_cov_17_982213_g3668_i0_p2_ORF_typecomplete_len101_score7_37zfC2HCIx2C/PF10782_9/0_011_NODE_4573_length_545_cov_17_982213_g3668_i0157459